MKLFTSPNPRINKKVRFTKMIFIFLSKIMEFAKCVNES